MAESEIEVVAIVLGGRLGDYIVGLGRQEGALLTLIDLRPVLGRTDPAARDAP